VAVEARSGTKVVLELKEAPLVILDKGGANGESPMLNASSLSPPAAAII
jgi:hypothetical protein